MVINSTSRAKILSWKKIRFCFYSKKRNDWCGQTICEKFLGFPTLSETQSEVISGTMAWRFAAFCFPVRKVINYGLFAMEIWLTLNFSCLQCILNFAIEQVHSNIADTFCGRFPVCRHKKAEKKHSREIRIITHQKPLF